jgi:hypothetical protein
MLAGVVVHAMVQLEQAVLAVAVRGQMQVPGELLERQTLAAVAGLRTAVVLLVVLVLSSSATQGLKKHPAAQ